MNIIDLQERLKDLPEEALMQEMQMPTGSAPQFLVLSELKRRKRMRDDYQRMQASDMKTVAEETITAAGMPQSGIMGVSQAMAPKSAIAQDTGLNDMQQMDPTQAPQPEQPMMMADGGYVKRMQDGGSTEEPGFMERLLRDIRKRFRASRMSDEEARWLIENYGVVPDALNPVSSAVDAMTAYNEGDYLGAGINALSSVPSGKFTGISANVAAELYNRYFGNDIEDADEPPLGMADGGYVRYMQSGGYPSAEVQQTRSILASDPGTQILAARMGMTVEEYIESLSPEARSLNIQRIAEGRRREGEVRADVFDPALPVLDQVSSDLSDFEPKDPSYLEYEKTLVDLGGANPSNKLLRDPDRDIQRIAEARSDVFPGDRSVFEMDEEYNRAKEQERFDAAVLDEMSKDRGLTEREPSFMQDVVPFLGDFAGATYDAVVPKRENIKESLSPAVEMYTDAILRMAGESEGKELPMDTGTPLEIPEDEVGSLLPPTQQEVVPDIVTSDAGAGTGAGAVGGARVGAGGGGGAFGSIEGRIAKMLEERDRSARADKWLALAQTGLALMASTQPTIGGAIGEAGLAGIGAMRDARSQYDEDILKLLGAQSDIEQYKDARRLAAAKAAASAAKSRGGLTGSNIVSRINSLEGDQRQLMIAISNAKNNPEFAALGGSADVDGMEQMFLQNQLVLQGLYDQLNRLGGGAGVASEEDFDATAS